MLFLGRKAIIGKCMIHEALQTAAIRDLPHWFKDGRMILGSRNKRKGKEEEEKDEE